MQMAAILAVVAAAVVAGLLIPVMAPPLPQEELIKESLAEEMEERAPVMLGLALVVVAVAAEAVLEQLSL